MELFSCLNQSSASRNPDIIRKSWLTSKRKCKIKMKKMIDMINTSRNIYWYPTTCTIEPLGVWHMGWKVGSTTHSGRRSSGGHDRAGPTVPATNPTSWCRGTFSNLSAEGWGGWPCWFCLKHRVFWFPNKRGDKCCSSVQNGPYRIGTFESRVCP